MHIKSNVRACMRKNFPVKSQYNVQGDTLYTLQDGLHICVHNFISQTSEAKWIKNFMYQIYTENVFFFSHQIFHIVTRKCVC